MLGKIGNYTIRNFLSKKYSCIIFKPIQYLEVKGIILDFCPYSIVKIVWFIGRLHVSN